MSHRKPETLRKMVSESRSISPPLIEKKTTPTDLDVLYNRIDQQVELISILKRRLDETTRKWEESVNLCDEQEKERSKLQISHDQLASKLASLDVRWVQLTENHKEMIELKDEYKHKNEKLMVKLRQYEKSESAVVETERKKRHAAMEEATELRNVIESRDLTIQDKNFAIAKLEDDITRLKEKNLELRSSLNREQSSYRATLSAFELKLDNSEKELNENISQSNLLKEEMSKLTDQIIHRGKLVHEKEDKINALTKEMEDKDNDLIKVRKELSDLHKSINSNKVVKDLRCEILDQEERYKKLELDLARFKQTAQERLQVEMNLNKELRHITSTKF